MAEYAVDLKESIKEKGVIVSIEVLNKLLNDLGHGRLKDFAIEIYKDFGRAIKNKEAKEQLCRKLEEKWMSDLENFSITDISITDKRKIIKEIIDLPEKKVDGKSGINMIGHRFESAKEDLKEDDTLQIVSRGQWIYIGN